MSEWASFIAVFWLLWAIDGVKIAPRAIFTVAEGWLSFGGWRWRAPISGRSRRGWTRFSRISALGPWPSSWRVTAANVPLAISPRGICNRPVGAAGRPTEAPHLARAWAWEDLREVTVADGWFVVNGARFCRDTGHLTAAELLALARLPPAAREARVRARVRRWIRPAHLRRRLLALAGRTKWAVRASSVAWTTYLCATLLVLAATAPEEMQDRLPSQMHEILLVKVLPWVLLLGCVAHFAGVYAAWRATKRLPAVAAQKRGMNLFTALLMPPQALRLRALVGEGFFPAQHPLAVILAFGRERARREAAFNVLADLQWPIGDLNDPPVAREILAWHRAALRAEIEPHLRAAGLAPESLLAPPKANGPAACAYCPRCGDQFVAGRDYCPQGVKLQEFCRSPDGSTP